MSSTSSATIVTTIQDIVKTARAYPDLIPVLGASGWTQEPALSIANDIMQLMLAQNLNWKFNREYIPPFLTVALQQDYPTLITDLGWVEQCWRVDINNVLAGGATGAPKPMFAMEAIRDILGTSAQANPFNISFVPNSLAFLGVWQANTQYLSGYLQPYTPPSLIQSFQDANGNILFLNSAALGLNIQSPGWNGNTTPQTGFGFSGSTAPSLPANSTPGTTVTDNDLIWTCADPNGVCMRLAPLPAVASLVWLIMPVYQAKPPLVTSLAQTIAPFPDQYAYLFRRGFIALCRMHAAPNSRQAVEDFQMWQQSLVTALKSADREMDWAGFYPSESLMGAGYGTTNAPVGPSNPYPGVS